MEPEKMHCDFCGCEIAEGDGMYVEGDLLCNDCVDEQTVTCEHCGEVIWSCNNISDHDTCLCQECFDRHYHRCESCDRIISEKGVSIESAKRCPKVFFEKKLTLSTTCVILFSGRSQLILEV